MVSPRSGPVAWPGGPTGSPETTDWLNSNEGQAYLDNAASKGKDGLGLYRLAEADPRNYANPRLVRFGLRASF